MQLIVAATLVNLTIKLNLAAFGFTNTKTLYHQTSDIICSKSKKIGGNSIPLRGVGRIAARLIIH